MQLNTDRNATGQNDDNKEDNGQKNTEHSQTGFTAI